VGLCTERADQEDEIALPPHPELAPSEDYRSAVSGRPPEVDLQFAMPLGGLTVGGSEFPTDSETERLGILQLGFQFAQFEV
jgi:hypothetical protein